MVPLISKHPHLHLIYLVGIYLVPIPFQRAPTGLVKQLRTLHKAALPFSLWNHLSSNQKLSYLLYKRDYTSQLCGDFFFAMIRIPIIQPNGFFRVSFVMFKWEYPINTHFVRCIWGWLLRVPSEKIPPCSFWKHFPQDPDMSFPKGNSPIQSYDLWPVQDGIFRPEKSYEKIGARALDGTHCWNQWTLSLLSNQMVYMGMIIEPTIPPPKKKTQLSLWKHVWQDLARDSGNTTAGVLATALDKAVGTFLFLGR